jgi:predicted dithiol-disulfide oxidoreductase (DUF899 family)
MTQHTDAALHDHEVVSHGAWVAARTALLREEKELTHRREELARRRRTLPWEKVEKDYVFEGPTGKATLSDLFDGRSQLIVYHFMFLPEDDQGCPHCSFWADHYDATLPHLNARDVSFAVIARAPLPQIEKFKQRMGWRFTWLSSGNTDFNYDFQVSFRRKDVEDGNATYNYEALKMNTTDLQGISVFYRDEAGQIFHTYSTFARGIDMVNPTYQFLDLVPKGRDEQDDDYPQQWVRYHDRYEVSNA